MAAQKTFRSALNGFNRDDVVHYIEYLNAQHASEVNQLTSEAEYLRSKLEERLDLPGEKEPPVDVQALETQLQAALEENKRLEEELRAAMEARDQAQADLEDLQTRQTAAQNVTNQELEAYRRAERVERLAQERSAQVYHRVNGVLADATVKVDEAAETIGTLSDQVLSQLNQLQEAVSGSKQALQDAAQTMYALRPEQENENQ